MNSAASLLQPESNPALYVSSVLILYVDLPDTPLRANTQDQRQARSWYDRGVPLSVVETALLLASLRRLARPPACRPCRASDRWPTSNRSSKNSWKAPSPTAISNTCASSSAVSSIRRTRLLFKKLRFQMIANNQRSSNCRARRRSASASRRRWGRLARVRRRARWRGAWVWPRARCEPSICVTWSDGTRSGASHRYDRWGWTKSTGARRASFSR